MDVGADWRVAAGAPQVVEYIVATETIGVPRVPAHCAGLLVWRDRLIPVVDLTPVLVEPATGPTRTNSRRAVILAYQEAPGQALSYGALLISAAPTEAWVRDDMAGPLPEAPAAFRHIARSCFMLEERAIPILDARQLFARPLPGALTPAADDVEDANHVSRVESALARHVEPANEAPRAASLARDMQLLRILRTENEPQALPPEPAGQEVEAAPGEDVTAQTYCVVIPFATGRSADATNSSPGPEGPVEVSAVTSDLPGQSLRQAESDAAPPITAAATGAREPGAVALANVVSGTGAAPKPSNTLRSFERLRAMERTGRPPDRHRLRWALLAAGLALAALTIALLIPMEKASPARDVAPGGIKPSSIPSAPAQPPK